ncbi:Glycosyl hydrolase, five-bladed beta-propellor domain containing protein [Quillaja saponaria]|uniref:Glycosyl hydrolase, five-bladed beta-propellor domain containing protein n=1 Tax=Quillaja saponaria TaxID=32244 RepID=A0AAD7KPN0_QUISA|nr:Glycosyl hydrolase, five-bladed beta-propellor domain containing protein [Quillaja saponaria]
MDAAKIAASAVKTFQSLAISNTQRLTNPTTLIPSWVSTKANMLTLYSPNSSLTNNSALTFTRCSTKPDTNTDSETDKASNIEPNSVSGSQKSSETNSSEAISSTMSSSSSSSSRGLVFDLGIANSWDSVEIGSPVVKRFLSDEEERWYMWYYGRSNGNPGSDLIGLAVSSNGIHWERGGGPVRSSGDVGLVLNCSKDWWAFDTHIIRPSEVVIMSSAKIRASSAVYWLYYTGYSSEKAEFSDNSLKFSLENPERYFIDNVNDANGRIGKVVKSLPGLAISQDGRYWARIEGEHHSGALFDVGSEREWDSLFISAPHVVFHSTGDLRMYYHSFDIEKGHFAVGIARSRDGIKWVKLGKIMGGGKTGSFDEFGAMNVCVVRNQKDGKYVMAYEGVAADGSRSIGLAVSPDGLKEWRRLQNEAILKPSETDCWDDKDVGYPRLVQMDTEADEWRLYYRGVGHGGRTGIGMALSEGRDTRSFRRWTGFHV